MENTITIKAINSLTIEEQENPVLVFSKFFEYAYLDDTKQTLERIKDMITKRKSLFARKVKLDDDTLYFFEKLEKLIEAAYLMR